MKLLYFAFAAFIVTCQSVLSAPPAGYVVGWGDNLWGEVTGEATPNDFTNGIATIHGQVLSNAVAVSAGGNYSLVIKSDGTVAAWGGQTDVPPGLSNVVAVSAGSYNGADSVALKNDGKVVLWGADDGSTNIVAGLSNVVAIENDIALKSDGKMTAWGKNLQLHPMFMPEELTNVIAIAGHNPWIRYAVLKDGTVVEWSLQGQIEVERIPFVDPNDPRVRVKTRNEDYKVVEGIKSPVALADGWSHILALKSDGTVFGWGANGDGESTGIPTKDPTKEDPYYAEGLVTIGGQVLSNVTAVAAGNHMSLALKKDGTVVSWGFSPYHRMDVPAGLSNVVAIAISSGDRDAFCLAITTNRAVAEKFHK
jgi:alpha-tubulin suppressor-like RCC1 family protein